MPAIGDVIPPERVLASTEELQRLVGRNTIGAGTRAQNGRARPPRSPRRTRHAATQAPQKPVQT